ncbi:MAG: hypothetical protein IKS98_06985 [Lachnospiraceae bacterium]|nr:hypothetical protein [Lachnospiraceae bacterium]
MKTPTRILETKQSVVYGCIFLCSILMSFIATNNPFLIGNTYVDSSVFNYVARVILNGGMPYRDTFDHKGPLIYLIDALGQLIHESLGLWFIELITIFFIFLLAYKTAKLIGCNNTRSLLVVLICMASMALYFEGGNLVEEYACLFIMLQLYIFLLFFMNKEISTFLLILSGFSFGAVCLLRINMVSLWIVMCIGVVIKCIRDKEARKIGRFIIWFLVGACIIILPIMIWLIAGGAFKPFIEDYFSFNFLYSSQSGNGGLVNIIKAISLLMMTPPVILSMIILAFVGFKDKKLPDWLCLASLLLSVLMQCMAGQSFFHYGMVFCPIVVYAFSKAFTSEHITGLKIFKHKAKLFLGLCTAIVIGIIVLIIIDFPIKAVMDKVTGIGKNFTDAKTVSNIVVDNTDENDKIIVLGNNDIIYLLSHRESYSKYSYQDPIIMIDADKKEEFLADIRKLETKIIVANTESVIKSYAEDILSKHYNLIGTIGKFEIYKKA